MTLRDRIRLWWQFYLCAFIVGGMAVEGLIVLRRCEYQLAADQTLIERLERDVNTMRDSQLKVTGNAESAIMKTKHGEPLFFSNIYFEVWSDVKVSTVPVIGHAN